MDQCTNVAGFAAVAALDPIDRQPADDVLVAAARAGDETAFELLFERHRRSVTRLAYRFFAQREQVEDIVQESFAAAYFALESYRGGYEKSFISWLSKITIRTCYSALRQSKRNQSSLSDLSEEEQSLLAERLRPAGLSNDVEKAAISRDLAGKLLQRLDPEDQVVLTLLDVAGLSVAEAAELTGWSAPKVKMRAHRARKALRRVLHKFV